MQNIAATTRAILLAAAVGLVLAACSAGSSQPRSRPPQASPPKAPVVARPLSVTLHQQELRLVRSKGANPTAVTMLASSRNLRSGQQGAVLTVRGVGNLVGSCNEGKPGVKFRLAYRGPGPAAVTRLSDPLARPVSLNLLSPFWPPAPARGKGKQQFAFFQITGGGESADFSLVVWATLTPVAAGCALTANGVLRVRGSGFLNHLG